MPAFPPPPALCTAIARSGRRCNFVARRDSGLCINHDPAYREQQRLNARRAAAASVAARRYRPINVEAVDLSSRVRIQVLLDAVMRLEILGRIPPSRARNLVRALSLAIRNFPPPSNLQRQYGRPVVHDSETYEAARSHLDHALLCALAEAEANDAARAAHSSRE